MGGHSILNALFFHSNYFNTFILSPRWATIMNGTLRIISEDSVLWQELLKGNDASYAELFRKYYSDLYFYGVKLSNDSELVKESIQEIFVRIWETKDRLSSNVSVKPYLLVSLRRMILFRKAESKMNCSLESIPQEGYLFSFEKSEFTKHDEVPDEIKDCVQKAISELTARQRELIYLFFYQGFSYREISTMLEISIPAVRNLMYRTLIHLRKKIGERAMDSMKNILYLVFPSFFLKKNEIF